MLELLLRPIFENIMPIIWGIMTVSLSYCVVIGMIVFFSIVELRHRSALELLDKRIELEKARKEGRDADGN